MSRNKQVDRLREGLDVFIDSGDIKDPVEAALGLLIDQRDDIKSLVNIIVEDKEFFEGLHAEMFNQGCSEGLVINHKGKGSGTYSISLGELGWVNNNPKIETAEDRARLIAINGMVMAHLRDSVLEQKVSKRFLKRANDQYSRATDKLHKTLMEVGIWKDPMHGEFYGMLDLFARSYEQMKQRAATLKQQRDEGEGILNALRKDLESSKTWIRSQDDNINSLIKELNYQRARADQLEKELNAMRKSIIKSKTGV